MTIKLALLDVDGTLKNDQEWAPGALELLKRLGEAGVPISLSSGRTPFSLREMVQDIPEVTFLAGSGGGVLQERTPEGWHTLGGHRISPYTVHPIIAETRDAGVELWIFTQDQWLVEAETETVKWDADITGSKYTVVNFDDITDEVVKMAIIPTDDEERDYAYSLVAHEGVAVVQSHPKIIDIVPDNAMRYKGGDSIIGHLGIMWRDVLAVGDGENDLGMLGAAYKTFLMPPLTLDRLPEEARERGLKVEAKSLQCVLDRLDEMLAEETVQLRSRFS